VWAVPKDPKDNPILACALEGNADFVVTDDRKHLLPMRSYHGIRIVSPPSFLRGVLGI
jgi:predicted nucleic acid-binding protein